MRPIPDFLIHHDYKLYSSLGGLATALVMEREHEIVFNKAIETSSVYFKNNPMIDLTDTATAALHAHGSLYPPELYKSTFKRYSLYAYTGTSFPDLERVKQEYDNWRKVTRKTLIRELVHVSGLPF